MSDLEKRFTAPKTKVPQESGEAAESAKIIKDSEAITAEIKRDEWREYANKYIKGLSAGDLRAFGEMFRDEAIQRNALEKGEVKEGPYGFGNEILEQEAGKLLRDQNEDDHVWIGETLAGEMRHRAEEEKVRKIEEALKNPEGAKEEPLEAEPKETRGNETSANATRHEERAGEDEMEYRGARLGAIAKQMAGGQDAFCKRSSTRFRYRGHDASRCAWNISERRGGHA